MIPESDQLVMQALERNARLQAGQAELSVTLHLYYCSHGQEALCYFKEVQLLIPIIVDKVGQTLLKTNYVIRQ